MMLYVKEATLSMGGSEMLIRTRYELIQIQYAQYVRYLCIIQMTQINLAIILNSNKLHTPQVSNWSPKLLIQLVSVCRMNIVSMCCTWDSYIRSPPHPPSVK